MTYDVINDSLKEFQTVSLEEQSKFPHTKQQLASWGVNWPKARGWGKRLAQGLDPNISTAPPVSGGPVNHVSPANHAAATGSMTGKTLEIGSALDMSAKSTI